MRAPAHEHAHEAAAAVKDVLDRAADLPRGERAAFLDAACAADEALRAEVESLLAALDSADCILATPTVGGVDLNTSANDALAGIGTEPVGRYKLLGQLGEGGFGMVYLAEQQRPVRRKVALKLIKPGMDSRQVVARFEAERQALALMDHPGIARVFDGGASDAGHPYFVMELIEGPPLTRYCDDNKLDVRGRLELLARVCDAVHHAHQKGVIHRDLKPTNVLVATRDGQAVPKVIDFGVAKALQGRLTEHSLHTEQRQLVGTPEYMSPEQAATGGAGVDTRSDVYALGVLLYELLTGVTPFDPKELRSKSLGEVERILREVEPASPSDRVGGMDGEAAVASAVRRATEPTKLRRLLRGELDWVAMRCLEKDPVRRYESAAALAADVRRHLAGEAVLARPTRARYRLGKFVRRHKGGVAAAVAVAAALLLGVVGTSVGMLRARAAEQEAKAGKALADSDAAHAKAAYAFVADIFEGASPYRASGGRDAKVADLLDGAVAKLERLKPYPEAELEVRHALARCYSALGMHEEQVAVSRGSYALAERVHGGGHALTLKWAAAIAGGLNNQKRGLDEVERLCRPALERGRRELGQGHAVTRNLAEQLARCYLLQGRFDDAESVLRQSLSVPPDVPVLGASDRTSLVSPAMAYEVTINLLRIYAMLELARGRSAAAEALAREAGEVRRQYPDIGPLYHVWPDWMLARALGAQDRTEEAEETLGRQMAFVKQHIRGGSPHQPEWVARHADVLTARRKFPEALEARWELLDLARAGGATGAEALTDLTLDVADLLWLTGDRAESDALRLRAADAGDRSSWRWRRAGLRPVLGDEAEWSNPGLFTHAWALTDKLLLGAKDAGDLVEDPAAAVFELAAWEDKAVRVVEAGTLAEAKRVGNQRPGVYRLTLELPRPSGPPLRGEAWVPLWPWVVVRYELDKPDPSRWAEVRANHKAPQRDLAALAMGDGWTHYAGPGGQRQNFGLVATASIDLPAGTYRVAATSDDGVCVWVDGRPVIEAWTPRPATTDEAVVELPAGRHEWRVEYFNAGGEFSLWLRVAPEARRGADAAGDY